MKRVDQAKAHRKYYLKDQVTEVPSITTVLGIISKPALVNWANSLGLKGYLVSKFVDDKARIGTLAHTYCNRLNRMLGRENSAMVLNVEDFSDDFTPNQKEMARYGLEIYYNWLTKTFPDHECVFDATEVPLVSERYMYGGTPDALFTNKKGNEYTLVEIKTSNAIYPEHIYQLAAQYRLIQEQSESLADPNRRWKFYVVALPRDIDEGFTASEIPVEQIVSGFDVFQKSLHLFNAVKGFKKEEKNGTDKPKRARTKRIRREEEDSEEE